MPIHDWKRVQAGIFHDFHIEWTVSIKRALNKGILPPGYYAMAEQWAGERGPDVLTLEKTSKNGREAPEPAGGTALAEAPPRVSFHLQSEIEYYTRKANAIVIRHVSGHNVVAMVEIVSPGNKDNSARLRQFLEKAREVLENGIHLLVLDVVKPNKRNPEGIHSLIWEGISGGDEAELRFHPPEGKPLTLASYIGGELPQAFVEPVGIGEKLIDMPLFIADDRYVYVPLEATYNSAFAEVPDFYREILEAPAAKPPSKRKSK